MSIVLKTDPKLPFGECVWKDADHDCKAAHAMQMAIEEASSRNFPVPTWGTSHAVVYGSGKQVCDWINERAAANLARMLGEGNG